MLVPALLPPPPTPRPVYTPDTVAAATIASFASASTRRNYSREVASFLTFARSRGPDGGRTSRDGVGGSLGPPTRDNVMAFVAAKREQGAKTQTLAVSIAAVKAFARECWARGLLSEFEYVGVERLRVERQRGGTVGNWLDTEGLERLLRAAGTTLHPARDQALVAVMVGCGLRRAEVCGLEWEQLRQRDSRWCLTDIRSKAQRVRTVAVPGWVAQYLHEYRPEGAVGSMFHVKPGRVHQLLHALCIKCGMEPIAPHDLRRTYARLCRAGGASLEHISNQLGHASIAVTERYLGSALELRPGLAAGDYIPVPDPNQEQESE